MITFQLPSAPSAQLLWAQATFVWILAMYAWPRGPYGAEESIDLVGLRFRRWRQQVYLRSASAAALVALLPGLDFARPSGRLGLALIVATSLAGQPFLRILFARRSGPGWRIPCLEIGGLVLTPLILGAAIDYGQLDIRAALLRVPGSTTSWTEALVIVSCAIFLTGGATHVVRALLDSVSAKPEGSPGITDLPEYNRGRVIGNLERILLLLLALPGAYAAMVLVIGAKGLVRWSDLSGDGQEDFTEYFLIGSLASLLMAVVGALLAMTIAGLPRSP